MFNLKCSCAFYLRTSYLLNMFTNEGPRYTQSLR